VRSPSFERTLERVVAELAIQIDDAETTRIQDNIRRYCDVNMVFGALSGNGGAPSGTEQPALHQHVWWTGNRLGQSALAPVADTEPNIELRKEHFPAYQVDTSIRNCWLATAAIIGVAPTAATLKRRFIEALNFLQRSSIPCDPEAVIISFENPELLDVMAREAVVETASLSDGHRFPPDEQTRIAGAIRDAFHYIRAVDPELHDLIVSVTGTIACIKRPGSSGSLSSLIGLVWLNPTEQWTIVDYAENIVHEFVHTSIFIEDLVWGVFTKPHFYTPPDSLVTSAILKYPRGFNISFHSVYVAVGLTIFLRGAHQDERAAEVAAGLAATVPQLRRIQDQHLTSHGKQRFAAIAS
jgi:hypothetical protein